MFQAFLFSFFLINKIFSKEYIMKKNTNNNNEFSPYTFQISFDNQLEYNYTYIFDTSTYIVWIGNQNLDNKTIIRIETINGGHIFGNEICTSSNFCWFKVDKRMGKNYSGVIGISNKHREIINNVQDSNNYYYLNTLNKNAEERFINFIQKSNNEASMIFGYKDDVFNKDYSQICQCKKNNTKSNKNNEIYNIYWCCELSSLKMGEIEIYKPSEGQNEYGIFSISEEFIIAPKRCISILNQYEKYILDKYNVKCKIKGSDGLIFGIICEYFNYIELPDLYFIMKEDICIVTFSSDLFKIIDSNNTLEFKIKVNNNTNEYWYIGEPIVKNYNLLLNYTNLTDVNLVIISSNSNGFVLIIFAIIISFIFFFIFIIIIIYIIKKNETNKEKSFFNYDNPKRENTFLSFRKNSSYRNNYTELIEKIEEENEEDSDNKKKNINIINKNSCKLGERINKDEYNNNINIGNGAINDNIITNSVEFILNDIGDDFDENDDLFIKLQKK